MSTRQLTILLALDDASAEPVLAGLPATATVHQVALAQAPAALAVRSFDVIISRWSDEWNRWLELHVPTPRFVHLGSPPPSLLRAAGVGVAAHACSSSTQLAALLDEVSGPPRSASRQQPVDAFEVRMEGLAIGRLVDFSNTGLSVCVPFGHSLSGLGADQLVAGLEVVLDGRTVLGPASLRIARLHAIDDGYVLGLTFEPDVAPLSLAPKVVTDPTRIVALLEAGARGRGLTLRAHEHPEVVATLHDGAVDVAGTVFESTTSVPSLPPLSLVDVEFEVTAVQCAFTGLLLEANPVKLRVPHRLVGIERRISERRQVGVPSRLRFEHPLVGRTVEVPIADISVDGVGVELPADAPPVPPGLALGPATLHLGDRAFPVRVRSPRMPRLEEARWRTGFRLDFVHPPDATEFARAWISLEFPSSEIVGTVDPAALVEFLLATRIAPASVDRAAAREVLARLQQAPPRLYWSLYCREGAQLVAAVNGVRRYPRTFTFQHFALGRHDRHLANLMVRVTVEMTLHDPSVEFVHCNYARSNAWSARFFGSGVAGLDDPDRSSIAQRELLFYRGVPTADGGGLEVRAPEDDHARALAEGLIAAHEPVLLMRAHAWQANDWYFEQLSDEWRACGLERGRSVFGVWDGEALLGVSIAELSSVAMNLREDLSAARLWLAPGLTGPRRVAATGALVRALGEHYRRAGRELWPLIVTPSPEDALPTPLERVGFAEVMIRRDAGQAISQVWAALDHADHEQSAQRGSPKS